ncbi:hypothetical protein ABVT39_010838 [Epinephelus coioides]
MELRDEDGIRTGTRRFYVRLMTDGDSGRLRHLPSIIQLGPIRGHVFYAGQPKTCRKCGSSSHLAADCNTTFCRNCQCADHYTKDCDQPRRCNLCGSSSHTFRGCPESYANRTRCFDPAFQHPEPPPAEEQQDLQEPDNNDNEPRPSAHNQPRPGDQQQPVSASQGSLESTGEGTQQCSILQEDHQESGVEDEPCQSSAHCQLDQPASEPQEMWRSQEDLPAGQLGQVPVERAPVSSKDCRDLLDLMLADLPPTGSPTSTSQGLNQVPMGDMGVPPSPPSFPNAFLETTPSRKRAQKTSSDSATPSPDLEVWSDLLPTSPPFLDPQSLSAFSLATQMSSGMGEAEGDWRKQKKKKKKRTKPPSPMV